ncbi:hypothetical protein B0H19DRAFT_908023, partial [Mycena capillaripes]
NDVIHTNNELPAFLVKPISRVWKYSSLLKACSTDTYQHYYELKTALAASRRVIDRVDDAQNKLENEQTAVAQRIRLADWRDHQLNTFGALLLDDAFIASKADIKQEE